MDFTSTQNLLLSPAVTFKLLPSTTLTVEGQYTREDGRSNAGQPAIGMYPASIPVSRSFLEPNEPLDRVRSALISYNLRHEINNDWTITNRFLAARGFIEKTDMTANDLSTTSWSTLDQGITYQKLTGTNYSANLDLTGKFFVAGSRHDILIGTDYYYQFFNYVLSGDGNYPINIYNPIYGTVPYYDFATAAAKAWNGQAGFRLFSSDMQRDLGAYGQNFDHALRQSPYFDRRALRSGGRAVWQFQ